MNPASVPKTRTGGAMVVSLASFLEADNERLRQAAAELSLQTTALRQELERMAGDDTIDAGNDG